jgi:aerobic-type carbon monoxide dehydrogenase small subunit (CoxS/CutS family)
MNETIEATLHVNGAVREVVADPARRLSDVLRG